MKEKILEILNDLRPDLDFEQDAKLVSDGILTSFDVITIVSEIEESFDIDIKPKYLTADFFNSVDSIVDVVKQSMEE